MQTVTDAATALTGAQFGAFFYNVVDAAGREAHALHALRRAARGVRELRPSARDAGLRADVLRHGDRPQRRHHAGRALRPDGRRTTACRRAICRCAAISPCRCSTRSGEVLGGLFFGHATPACSTQRSERLAVGHRGVGRHRDGECAALRGRAQARDAAEDGEPREVGVPREHVARASHAAQRDRRLCRSACPPGIRGPVTDDAARRPRAHQAQPAPSAVAHQRHPELREDRSGPRADEAARRLDERSARPARGDDRAAAAREEADGTTISAAIASYTAYVDPERLQQILLNLLSNAVKFTPAGRRDRRRSARATADAMVVRVSRHRRRHSRGQARERVRAVRAARSRAVDGRRRHGARACRSVAISRARWAAS